MSIHKITILKICFCSVLALYLFNNLCYDRFQISF